MSRKVVVVYQAIFEYLTPTGKVAQRTLNPRDSYEKAEEALKVALLVEGPGSNGQIEKFFLCVNEEEAKVEIETPPDSGKLILPDSN